MNPILSKSYDASADIPARRIVHFSGDGQVATATGQTDKNIGVSEAVNTKTGQRCDVVLVGLADIEFGGNVSRGDRLTADAQGRAVTVNPGSGVTAFVIGTAHVSAVAGDFGPVLVNPSQTKG